MHQRFVCVYLGAGANGGGEEQAVFTGVLT